MSTRDWQPKYNLLSKEENTEQKLKILTDTNTHEDQIGNRWVFYDLVPI